MTLLARSRLDSLLTKAADLGSDGADIPFEQAFSNLAHAYLKDRAPGLMDYEVGFQLVERNDDNTKAVGILGFKVGSQWLYGPVFFINGDLKGHELLYIKNQDKFVPLAENWINHLLAKKPASLGEGVGRNTRELGVHYPDMFRALQSPHKYASAADPAWVKRAMAGEFTAGDAYGARVAWAAGERAALAAAAAPYREKLASVEGVRRGMKDWAVVAVADLAKAAMRHEPHAPALLDVVARGGVKRAAALHATFEAYPQLRVAFEAFYKAADVAAALERVRAEPRPTRRKQAKARRVHAGSVLDAMAAEKRARLEVHRFRGFDRAPSVLLDPADREALVAAGLLIKDARADDEVSTAYAVPTRVEFEKKFTNPDDSGLYDVLTKDGDLKKCLVVVGPLDADRRQPYATVIALGEGKKSWLNIHPSHVFVAKQYKGWKDWYDGLPEAGELATGYRHKYVIVAPSGEATLPFEVTKDLGGDAGGGTAYEVRFDSYCAKPRAGESTGGPLSHRGSDDFERYDKYRDGERVHLGQKTGTKFRSNRGDVYVPAGYKLIKLKDDEGEKDPKDDMPGCCSPMGQSDAPPLVPGNAIDVELGIMRKLARLTLRHDGPDAIVNDARLRGDEALVHLVADHGFREATAARLLKEAADAQRKGHAGYEVLVKYADPYTGQPGGRGAPYLTDGGPSAPSMIDPQQGYDDVLGSGVAAQHPLDESLPVEDLKPDVGNRDVYDPMTPDSRAIQVAQDAADKGQKEVFDTAMVGNLLKMTRDDDLIDDDASKCRDGLDRVGRLLFKFYWHGDRFADRFGDQDMPELEDSLRNTFESLGDLVLFLMQKSVEASPDEAAADIDLGETADQ